MKKTLIMFVLLISTFLFASKEMNLPSYEITISEENLAQLEADPTSDQYYPATFTYDDVDYSCEVRFRGQSSLVLFPEKRNWKVKFDSDETPFGKKKINLNAEYSDKSLMRNYLVMNLYREMGFESANVSYRNLFVNGVHKGLFIQVENMDEEFLEDHNFPDGDLYKGRNHGANSAPLVETKYYPIVWDKNTNEETGYDNLQEFLYWLYFANEDDFNQQIDSKAEVDNIINYFAITFALSSVDCITKNLFFYKNLENNKFSMFPWDNDGSLGNVAPYGTYNPDFETLETHNSLENNTIFRRLMDNDQYYEQFWNRVNEIRTTGFEYLHAKIDSTYSEIQTDFYNQADSLKVCSNAEFDAEIGVLHNFLNVRSDFLDGFTNFDSDPLSNYYVNNEFPTPANPRVDFRVNSSVTQGVLVLYAYDINFDDFGASFSYATCHLYDDGEHNDGEAEDLIYGNHLNTFDLPEGLIVYTYINFDNSTDLNKKIQEFKDLLSEQSDFIKNTMNSNDRWSYPYNGIFYLSYYKNVMLALNKIDVDPENYNELTIENVYQNQDDYFVEIKNNSQVQLDLSYFYLNYKDYFRNFIIPQNNVLQPNQTLIVTSNPDFAESYFPNSLIVEGLYFDLEVSNELKLLSPSLNEITSYNINEINQFNSDDSPVVINEINYNSSDEFNPQDWIELYNNSSEDVDISNWDFKDSDDSHSFILPENTIIPANEYLVLAKDIEIFQEAFPNVENVIGSFGFGLSGGGELIRLFNDEGLEVDRVEYSDSDPWDENADGNGPTLELINPNLDNNNPENWSASTDFGTPGEQNSNYTLNNDNVTPSNIISLNNFPNPFNPTTKIEFSLNKKGKVNLSIYNIKGQKIKTLINDELSAGKHNVYWKGNNEKNKKVASGIYFYKLQTEKNYLIKKCLLLK